ncbi:MAG TPA: amidohydrolase family protein [Dinghuibacter sp.]|uniref:amidohydrolase family protein n=1 Tax=Dinghuibacter sp. TaxID=2024697 RepID=UPI002D18AFC8|nr:amidohydrolase family protein [Dinghuibacter sp.]HTJ11310.1 amidohydrolase family protein [Dinghuibacter sp.]
MRIVTLEEHISLPEMTARLPKGAMSFQKPELADITGDRLKAMDEQGVTLQVLSVDSLGAQLLGPDQSPAFAKEYNDLVAEKIAGHGDRFAAFAHLPMTAPAATAGELERVVKKYGFKGAMIRGMTGDKFLDHPDYEPLLAKAEELQVPVYIHPGIPHPDVAKIYYGGLPDNPGIDQALACYGWGWHAETAVQVLRLYVAGIFDRHPGLKVIIGHMGEMLPMMLERSNRAFANDRAPQRQRSLKQTFREQLYITTSGFFTFPPLQLTLDTMGVDNILFSIDYPFSDLKTGVDFLNNLPLPDDQKRKIAHANADKLLHLEK